MSVSRSDAKLIAEAVADCAEAACRHKARADRIALAATDALAGWRYIRRQHGDLYGVGWDRVEEALAEALK